MIFNKHLHYISWYLGLYKLPKLHWKYDEIIKNSWSIWQCIGISWLLCTLVFLKAAPRQQYGCLMGIFKHSTSSRPSPFNLYSINLVLHLVCDMYIKIFFFKCQCKDFTKERIHDEEAFMAPSRIIHCWITYLRFKLSHCTPTIHSDTSHYSHRTTTLPTYLCIVPSTLGHFSPSSSWVTKHVAGKSMLFTF